MRSNPPVGGSSGSSSRPRRKGKRPSRATAHRAPQPQSRPRGRGAAQDRAIRRRKPEASRRSSRLPARRRASRPRRPVRYTSGAPPKPRAELVLRDQHRQAPEKTGHPAPLLISRPVAARLVSRCWKVLLQRETGELRDFCGLAGHLATSPGRRPGAGSAAYIPPDQRQASRSRSTV